MRERKDGSHSFSAPRAWDHTRVSLVWLVALTAASLAGAALSLAYVLARR
jgi:hypothetical protein